MASRRSASSVTTGVLPRGCSAQMAATLITDSSASSIRL
jgi:hypothetical protein